MYLLGSYGVVGIMVVIFGLLRENEALKKLENSILVLCVGE